METRVSLKYFVNGCSNNKQKLILNDDALAKVENNMMNINCLKDEVINMKDTVVERLLQENEGCNSLESNLVINEFSLGQYRKHNNIVIGGIIYGQLEEAVTKLLADVAVTIEASDIEACYRCGKSDRKTMSKKTAICFSNRKHCKKPQVNSNEDPAQINSPKYLFNWNKKLFINENLANRNENLAYHIRKLKWSGLIHLYFIRNGVVPIKYDGTL